MSELLNQVVFNNKKEFVNDEISKLITSLSQVCETISSLVQNLQRQNLPTIKRLFSCTKEQSALILVDFQYDFVCGSLRTDHCPSKQNGVDIVNTVNKLLQLAFRKVFVSYDWHPKDHISFYENKHFINLDPTNKVSNLEDINVFDVVKIIDSHGNIRDQKLWPTHCVANTPGSQLYSDIKLPESYIPIYKGTIVDVESCSVFGDPLKLENTGLLQKLNEHGIRLLVLCGIAFDVCVAASALDAARNGFQVVVVEDACVGISPEGIAEKRAEMIEAGVFITKSENIPALLSGELVPLQHIIQVARDKLS